MFLCPGWWHGTGTVVGKVKAELLFTKAHHSRRRHSVQALGGREQALLVQRRLWEQAAPARFQRD